MFFPYRSKAGCRVRGIPPLMASFRRLYVGVGGGFAFSRPAFAFPCISGTGGTVFLGKCVMLLLSVPWGALGSGLRMPFLAI